MIEWTMRQGSSLPSMTWQVVDSAIVVPDLSAATAVYLVLWPPSSSDERMPDQTVEEEVLTGSIEDAATLRVDWQADGSDAAEVGVRLGLFHVHIGGRVLKVPSRATEWIRIRVTPDPSTTP